MTTSTTCPSFQLDHRWSCRLYKSRIFLVLPETGESAKHGASSHSHCEAHHEAHLDTVKTAGLGLALAVRTYSHWHLRRDT